MVKLVLAAVETTTFRGAMLEGLLKPALDDLGLVTATTGAGVGETVAADLATDAAGTGLAGAFTALDGALLGVLFAIGLAMVFATTGVTTLDFGLAFSGVFDFGWVLDTGLAANLVAGFAATLEAGLATGFLAGLAAALVAVLVVEAFLTGGADLRDGLATGFATGLLAVFAFTTGLATGLAAGLAAGFLTAAFTGLAGLATTLAEALAGFAAGLAFLTIGDFFAGAFTSCLLTEPATLWSALRTASGLSRFIPILGDFAELRSARDCSDLPAESPMISKN